MVLEKDPKSTVFTSFLPTNCLTRAFAFLSSAHEILLARVASSYFISKVYGHSIGQTALDALDRDDYSSSLTLFLPLLCMTLLVSGFPASLTAVPYWFLIGSSSFLCPQNVGVPYCFVSGDLIYSYSFTIGCADSFPVYIPGLPLS